MLQMHNNGGDNLFSPTSVLRKRLARGMIGDGKNSPSLIILTFSFCQSVLSKISLAEKGG